MKRRLEEHPTGIGASIGAALVVLGNEWGWFSFSGAESAIVVGGIAAALSLLSPRFREN